MFVTPQSTIPTSNPPVMPGVVENSNFKNRLQEYTQRASIPLPIYVTEYVTLDGSLHQPQFRSSVTVDGETYTSLGTFPNKKAAEQNVAKLAFEEIDKKIKDCISKQAAINGFPIHQDKVFCKSILHEFAVKMNMKMPEYENYVLEGRVPLFSSCVTFNGVKYVGEPGLTKKEAEQFGARRAILSILINSGMGMQLSEVIKSKAKLFSVVHEDIHANEVSVGQSTGQTGSATGIPVVPSVQPNVGAALETSSKEGFGQSTGQINSATVNPVVPSVESNVEPNVGAAREFYAMKVSGQGTGQTGSAIGNVVATLPSLGDQTTLTASAKKRKNRKKNKAAKKAKMETEAQVSELLVNQGMP